MNSTKKVNDLPGNSPQLVTGEIRTKAKYMLKLFVHQLEGAGVNGAVITTIDGFEVAAIAMSEEESNKLSAMSSSISAIGEMAVAEANAGTHYQSITIESDSGYIFIVNIRYPGCPMLLSVVASKEAMLGKLIYYAKHVVEKMCEI